MNKINNNFEMSFPRRRESKNMDPRFHGDDSLVKKKTYLIFAAFLLVFIVSGFLLKNNKKPVSITRKPLTFTRQLIGSNQYIGEIKGVMKTSFGQDKDGGRVTIDRNESKLEFGLPINNSTIVASSGNAFSPDQISFESDNKIIEAKYSLVPNGLKEEIILNRIPQENKLPIKLKTENLKMKITPDGIPVFYKPSTVIPAQAGIQSSADEYMFHFERPFMKDGAGNVSYGVRYIFGEEKKVFGPQKKVLLSSAKTVPVEEEQGDGKTGAVNMMIELDSDWLHDPKRVLPIIIDPTVVHDTSAEFATGQQNRVKDTGSGSSPTLESYYQELPVDQYTVGLWHMNESADNTCSGGQDACDTSGNANHGTATGTTINTTTPRLGAGARTFNGSSDFINMGNGTSLPSSGDITLEAWFKTTESSAINMIASHGTTSDWLYWFGKDASNFFRCKFYQANSGTAYLEVISTITVNDGSWHHGACVMLGTSLSIYVDGKLAGSSSSPAGTRDTSTAGNLYIGKFDWSTTYNFNGSLDEVRVSNTARSAEQIKSAASRRPYSVFTSDVIDLNSVLSWNSLTWTELGVATGDGETLKDSTSLVAQWNFNATTSTTTATNDAGSCGVSCNGTLTNFGTGSTGQDVLTGSGWTANNKRWGAGALMFDGTDDYVSAADIDFADQMTGEVWVKFNNVSNQQFIIRSGGTTATEYNLQMQGSGNGSKFRIRVDNASTFITVDSIEGAETGKWYHVVWTYNGTNVYLYINGKLINSAGLTGNIKDDNNNTYIGSSATPSFFINGTIDSTRIYSRALSAAEIISNYQAGNIEFQTRVGADASPDDGSWEAWRPTTGETAIDSFDTPIAKSLVGYWPLDESSSTRFDRWGINNLTANGTGGVGTGTGKLNGAADFESTESDFLEIADNTALSTGDIDFTISAWVMLESESAGGTQETIIGKYESSTNAEYKLAYNGDTTDKFRFTVYNSSGTIIGDVLTNTFGTVTTGVWYHLVAYHDSVNNQVGIKVNNGTFDTAATSGVPSDTTANFRLGARETTETAFFDGLIDEVGFWKRTLSADEISYLYSSGSPKNTIYGTESTNLAQFGGIKPSAETVVVQENSASTKYTTGRPDIDGSTVGLWHLDETGGTSAYIKDSTANANNGTPTGTTVVNGISGKGRIFNGTSDYIRVPAGVGSSLDIDTNPVTMEAWIKPNSISGEQHIVSRGTRGTVGYGLVINYSSGLVNVGLHGGSNFNGTTVLSPGTWYHVVGVINGASSAIYINGKLDTTGTVNVVATDLDLHIGSSWNGSAEAYFFNGIIDEVRVSNIARTTEEIAESYRAGRDHYINKTISSTDLSGKSSLPFYVAADRPGTYLESIVGESAFANYQPDASTVGQWHLDETTPDYAETPANTSGLVGWWKMNESSGNALDSSGNGFTAVPTGTTVVAGRSNYSRSLNGSASDYLTVTENDALDPAAITVEAWIKPNVLQTGNFVNKGDNLGYRFRINSGGTVTFFDRGGTNAIGSISTLTSGIWYHVAATGDSSGLKIYINGAQTNSNAVAYGSPNTANNLIMGYYSTAGTEAFSGTMDEVRIFNRALTAAEIAHDAAFTQPKDVSGNANHGSLWGTTSTQGKIGKARNLNGTSDRISISNINISNSSFTIQAWAKRGVAGVNHVFLGQGAYGTNTSLHLGFRNTNVFMCAFYGNDLNTSTTFTDTNWHLWTCTYDASTNSRKLYQDGIFIASDTASADYQGTGTLYIGSDGAGGSYFNGLVDEVRIDNTVRTATEIRQAYEVGLRTHPITIDFGASLDSGNLITGSGDLGFTVDATYYGLNSKGSNIYTGDKIIVRENYDGTEYIAQGTVTSVNISTGAVTVSAWDSGSTFPGSGYTVNSSIFKWQREYWNIKNETLDSHTDAITNLTLRLTDGSEGRTIWLDDLKSNTDYLTTPGGSTITSSTGNRYFQYRVVNHSNDESVSASITSVSLDYTWNNPPNTPTLDIPINTATNQALSPLLKTAATDTESDYLRYKIEICTNVAMTTNCQTFDQTSSQTGWSGQNAQTNTAYTSGTQATYTIQTPLSSGTIYYWRSYAIDPAGNNNWSVTQGTPYSFTTSQSPNTPTLDSPTSGTIDVPVKAVLKTTATDNNGDYLRYKIEVCTNVLMTIGCQTYDQTSSQTGWSGQNTQSNTAYTSGTQATYTVQSALNTGTDYYWRSYAKDPAGGNAWGSTQSTVFVFSTTPIVAPSAPTALLTNGSTNPTGVLTTTLPYFSAIHNDIDNQSASYYQIIVSSQPDVNGAIFWDSGQTVMSTTANGTRSSNITYAGNTLSLNGQVLYWKIRFWDTGGNVGTWSAPASFTLFNLAPPSSCMAVKDNTNTQITISWLDQTSSEDGYYIEKNTDGAGFVNLVTKAANSLSHTDSSVSSGHSYQYRIRATNGSDYSDWCTTNALNLAVGNFKLDGLQLNGIQLY